MLNQLKANLQLNYTISKIFMQTKLNPNKKQKNLPIILSKNQINLIINSISNQKHKLMLSISYGAGLRVSELVNLKVEDINIKELTVHIKTKKGQKDRISIIPEKIISDLEEIINKKSKNDYLFSNEHGKKITTRTAQKVFENALKITNIKKELSFHSLRHSFAAHLLENCVDMQCIQSLLGHKNIRTTQIYKQVSSPKLKNIKSPL